MTVQELYDLAKENNSLDYQITLLDWPFNGDYSSVTSKSMSPEYIEYNSKNKTILIS